MDSKLKSVKNKVGSIKPSEQKRVVFIRSNGVFYRPESSFMDICRYANVKDATEDLHYTQSGILSQEEVVRLNPDAFVIPTLFLTDFNLLSICLINFSALAGSPTNTAISLMAFFISSILLGVL